MAGIIPKEELSEFRRWHIGGFGETQTTPIAPAEPAAAPASEPEETPLPVPALPTAEEIERIIEQARAEGYAAGVEEGRLSGEREGEEARRQVLTQLQALVDNARLSLAELDQQVAEKLLALAVEIAAQTLRSALSVKTEALLPTIREAIATLPLHHAHIVIHLNPDDADPVRTRIGEAFFQSGGQIVEDSEISPGGCRLTAGTSEVDASIETRWQRVLESIGAEPRAWLKES